jgi:FtsP/CotA-like multicopper oxidase with cupredoxin domain
LKNISLNLTAVIVLLFTSLVPYAIGQSQTLTDEEIQAEILRLQQILAEKHVVITPADLLATGNLTKPTVGSLQYDALKHCTPDQKEPAINSSEFQGRWRTYLTDFHCGHVVKRFANNNTALRTFTLIAHDNQGFGNYVNVTKNATDPVVFPAWLFNNSLPAPTMRMTQGDHVKITVINSNTSLFPHSFHMHSIHSGMADGMTGPGGTIQPGANFTYEFIARPYGVYPFHCHMENVQYHLGRGLYGMMIIDPPTPRPPAREMVMLMNGYSFNQIDLVHPNNAAPPFFTTPTAQQLREATDRQAIDAWKSDDKRPTTPAASTSTGDDGGSINTNNQDSNSTNQTQRALAIARDARIQQTLSPGPQADNQIYTVNGKAFAYTSTDALHLVTGRNYRIYLANLLEFDPVNSFHMHGNMFGYIPSGTSMKPEFINDILTLGQGDRGILEFDYKVPGDFMFHSHINRFALLGWTGFFHVTTK